MAEEKKIVTKKGVSDEKVTEEIITLLLGLILLGALINGFLAYIDSFALDNSGSICRVVYCADDLWGCAL